jgi:ADP-L-glycero-D-manno-heptose 6-epimerase
MIILTGGAGFIGSVFLWKLNQEGIRDIIVVDHLDSSEKWKNLSGKRFSDYIQKDDFLALVGSGKIGKADHVVHIGANSSTTCTDADHFIRNNFEYSKALAKWALKNKTPFMYASSAATYGDGELGYSDSDDMTPRLKPLNMYGYSKQLFDMWVLQNKLAKKVTGLKFFNVFGPNEYHKGDMMSVVCKKYEEVAVKGYITLFKSYRKGVADGEQKRDFIYVKDVADVMFKLFSDPGQAGIFNLGTGKAQSWNDLAKAMFKAEGKKARIEYIDMPEYLRPKYQYFTEAEMTKLEKTGCAVKFRSLEESVGDYVVNYLSKKAYL